MENGKIKTLVRDRKFGFIAREGKPDIFFHADALQGVAYDDLKEGDAVTFSEGAPKPDGRTAAENVALAQ